MLFVVLAIAAFAATQTSAHIIANTTLGPQCLVSFVDTRLDVCAFPTSDNQLRYRTRLHPYRNTSIVYDVDWVSIQEVNYNNLPVANRTVSFGDVALWNFTGQETKIVHERRNPTDDDPETKMLRIRQWILNGTVAFQNPVDNTTTIYPMALRTRVYPEKFSIRTYSEETTLMNYPNVIKTDLIFEHGWPLVNESNVVQIVWNMTARHTNGTLLETAFTRESSIVQDRSEFYTVRPLQKSFPTETHTFSTPQTVLVDYIRNVPVGYDFVSVDNAPSAQLTANLKLGKHFRWRFDPLDGNTDRILTRGQRALYWVFVALGVIKTLVLGSLVVYYVYKGRNIKSIEDRDAQYLVKLERRPETRPLDPERVVDSLESTAT